MTNRTLLKIIKVRLDNTKEAWSEELPTVLWAYKTMARTPTSETPFRLTYGTEAMISVEVGVTSLKRKAFNEECNDDELRLNLNCLDEVRDKASNKMTKYQLKIAKYYNKRVKLRRLDIGDLVLRKTTTATKDPKENWVPQGKGLTGLFITQDKAITTWKPWTNKDSLDHGTLSI